jgi:hypothetical protein
METKMNISDELDTAAVIAATAKWQERAPKIRASYLDDTLQDDLQPLQPLQGLQAL